MAYNTCKVLKNLPVRFCVPYNRRVREKGTAQDWYWRRWLWKMREEQKWNKSRKFWCNGDPTYVNQHAVRRNWWQIVARWSNFQRHDIKKKSAQELQMKKNVTRDTICNCNIDYTMRPIAISSDYNKTPQSMKATTIYVSGPYSCHNA